MSYEDGTVVVNGKTWKLVTLDAETAYSQDYTLAGKMNTSEYVRDQRFKVHGWAYKVGAEPCQWLTGDDIERVFANEIDWENTAVIGHNLAFDGFILSERYGRVPGLYIDTLSMARAVHGHHTRHNLDTIAKLHGLKGKEKAANLHDTKGIWDLEPQVLHDLGEYAKDDGDETYEIFWKMFPYMPDHEMRLVDLTMRMFCTPTLLVDIPRVEAEYEREIGVKAVALKNANVTADQMLSNLKFADLLREAGVEPPTKISPATGKETYAFSKSDMDFKALAEHPSSRVRDLYWARMKVKSTITETRAARFIEAGKDGRRLPVLLNYSGAHTHRWSAGNSMNLQNLKRGSELRRSIIAQPGHVLIVADSAQIEARTLAWVAGNQRALDMFKTGDNYIDMASVIYNVPYESIIKDTPECDAKRFVGKVAVLGLGYGCGAGKFGEILRTGVMGPPVDISDDEARAIVNKYRSIHRPVVDYWRTMDQAITAMATGREMVVGPLTFGKNFCRLPGGLFLQYHALHGQMDVDRGGLRITEATYLTRNGRAKLYGGLLTENVVQAMARDIVAEQMLKVRDETGCPVVMMTHDEMVIHAPEDKAEEYFKLMKEIMSQPPAWAPGLPLGASGGFARDYSK